MHERVLNFFYFVWVPKMSKSAKTRTIKINSQRLVRCDQYVNSHVKFLSSYQKRVHYVLLDDIRLSLGWLRLPAKVVFPLCYLREFIQQENAFALTFANWLHDPNSSLLLELFYEKRVVPWQVVSHRIKVVARKINKLYALRCCFVKLSFFFKFFALAF